MIDLLILRTHQTVYRYFMPNGSGITFIVRSHVRFLADVSKDVFAFFSTQSYCMQKTDLFNI